MEETKPELDRKEEEFKLNLEEEFQDLIEGLYHRIAEEQDEESYTNEEGNALAKMVKDKTGVDSFLTNYQSYGKCKEHEDQDCGWSPSMGYHCT